MERFFYRQAAHITCVSRPMRDYLLQQSRTPVSVVYNGAIVIPTEVAGNSPADAPRTEKTILYAGNLGFAQELDLLVRAFAGLQDRHCMRDWFVELLGAGTQREGLQALIRELNMSDRIRLLPAVGRDEAAQRMASADILYLHLKHDPTLAKTIPSKLFDYLLAGRPIVGGLEGEGRELLESTGANEVFSPGDMQGLQKALCRAASHWPQLQACAERNRQLVFERFTRQRAYQVLKDVFVSVVEAKTSRRDA
jgi:glycosyltransferase involved in cell wall biosynthesis